MWWSRYRDRQVGIFRRWPTAVHAPLIIRPGRLATRPFFNTYQNRRRRTNCMLLYYCRFGSTLWREGVKATGIKEAEHNRETRIGYF